MQIDWDVPIEMDDGLKLRCDVFRPTEEGESPVIMSYGVYGKLLHTKDGYAEVWEQLTDIPDVMAGTTGKYVPWEVVDPEKWVPDGYAVVRVDSRGAGRSPGYLDPWSTRETRDFAQCIEWAGDQSWSNGRVGLAGISYYAVNQWQVAELNPEPLKAICPWEGFADFYREPTHNGGIYMTFMEGWYDEQVKNVQYGIGENGYVSSFTGEFVGGPETLTKEELGSNRIDLVEELRSTELATDEWPAERTPDLSEIDVPLLSTANWGGQPLHPRGNYAGYREASTDEKYLEIHSGSHWAEFYTDYGLELQKRFFGYYLKDEDTGWDEQPPVQMQVRRPGQEYRPPGETFDVRYEDDWPIPRTNWTRYYLDATDNSILASEAETTSSVTYDAFGDGVTFFTDPIKEETEITGPISSKLFVSSDTEDADLFLVVRVFSPDNEEVVFQGTIDPNTPIAQGWLRASHRKLDEDKSEEYRPYHAHDEVQPLEPGEIYELDIEIHPTCIVVPAGYRIALSIRGTDYEYPGAHAESFKGYDAFTGVGLFRHDDHRDRPTDIYGGDVTVHTGPQHLSSVLFPIIPESE